MPPFRAEHIGSLLRPDDLLDVRAKIRDGASPESVNLESIEKRAVKDILNVQTECGFRAVSTGEYNRTRFWGLFWDELDGTTRLQDAEASMFRLYHPDVVSLIEKDRKVMPGDSVIAGSKIENKGTASNAHELALLQEFVPKERWGDVKLTMITPAWFHMRYKQGKAYTPEAYSNDKDYFRDVAKAYNTELRSLYDKGLRNVQFDDPGLAYFCSDVFRDGFKEDKDNIGDVDDLLDAYIQLYNDCIDGLPSDFHTGVHLCRGNFIGGRHFASGAYDIIATKLFKNLNVNTFYLEYDTERAGGFEPLRHLPKDKTVILGIISTKLRDLEEEESVKARINKAADFVADGQGVSRGEALKRLGLSPQCGFSTHETGYPLSHDDQKAKLKLVRKIADDVWGEP
jgi:methionine synthase II (cobalamin-independent)